MNILITIALITFRITINIENTVKSINSENNNVFDFF